MAYYPFHLTRTINGQPEPVVVLYHYANGEKETALEEQLESSTNRRLTPGAILILCVKGTEEAIRDEFGSLPETSKSRLQVTRYIKILPYDIYGNPVVESEINIRTDEAEWSIDDDALSEIAYDGMTNLIERTDVVMRAPRGYLFRKPSSNTHQTFIRAGNMFKEPAALSIVTHLLMRSLPTDIEILYIDSFTILSAALAFQKDRRALAAACSVEYVEPQIINLHSYSIDPKHKFPAHTKYRVLISATTSGGLAQKLVDEHGASSDQIHHLLCFSSKDSLRESSAYFTLPDVQKEPEDAGFHKEISIPGEEFIASHGAAHIVNITTRHVCAKEGETYQQTYYQEALALNLVASNNSQYSLFSLPEKTTTRNEKFNCWLEDEIKYNIPANVGWILAVDSERSNELAQAISRLLKETLNKEVPVLSLKDWGPTKDKSLQETDGTVLIVVSDTGSGEPLLAASRALREVKHGHRHYLAAHIFPESFSRYQRLQKNLCMTGKERKYGWSCFRSTSVGKIEQHDSWYMEHECIVRGIDSMDTLDTSALLPFLSERIQTLGKAKLTKHELFLPRVDFRPLKLRPESVLFQGKYGDISQPSVYLMVSAALQRARDQMDPKGKRMDEELCFHGNPFISSILDPDMFSRYNDGVIQAAFLRACTPDELNYSVHVGLSRQVRDILISAIQHCESGSGPGEAIFEMLLALATKRIKLSDTHIEDVVVELEKIELLQQFWTLLNEEPAF